MSKIRLLNFMVGAVVIEEDDDGNILRKIAIDPIEAFGQKGITEAVSDIKRVIDEGMPGLPPLEEPKPNRAQRRSSGAKKRQKT